jgi:hypothetical protein
MWSTDSAWNAWFAAIPDVDAQAAKDFETAIDANADLGSTPAERQQQLARARSVARNAIWINGGLVIWAFFYPHPYELLIIVLGALPWVAILTAGLVWAIPSVLEKLGTVVLTLTLLMAYGYGASALANAMLDHSSGSIYSTTVHGKHVSGGRIRTPTLRLGPGAFGIPWYGIAKCQPNG